MGSNVNGPAAGQRRRDGRTERWRDHRIERRREFVDAALRLMARRGPRVSVGEIAAEAGAAKPKLYRHFRDKSDLLDAVSERILEMTWQRLVAVLDPAQPPAAVIRQAVSAYVGVVDEYPETIRQLLQASIGGGAAPKALAHGHRIAEAITDLVRAEAEQLGARAPWAGTYGHALAGAVSAATLWWLDSRAIGRDDLIEQLTTLLEGATDAMLRSSGIIVDLNQPIPSGASAG